MGPIMRTFNLTLAKYTKNEPQTISIVFFSLCHNYSLKSLMAVFSQIKNFIKSGKSYNSTGSSLSRRSTTQKYETAARMVEEENIAKQTMPSYHGLENYQLKTKLGE